MDVDQEAVDPIAAAAGLEVVPMVAGEVAVPIAVGTEGHPMVGVEEVGSTDFVVEDTGCRNIAVGLLDSPGQDSLAAGGQDGSQ